MQKDNNDVRITLESLASDDHHDLQLTIVNESDLTLLLNDFIFRNPILSLDIRDGQGIAIKQMPPSVPPENIEDYWVELLPQGKFSCKYSIPQSSQCQGCEVRFGGQMRSELDTFKVLSDWKRISP